MARGMSLRGSGGIPRPEVFVKRKHIWLFAPRSSETRKLRASERRPAAQPPRRRRRLPRSIWLFAPRSSLLAPRKPANCGPASGDRPLSPRDGDGGCPGASGSSLLAPRSSLLGNPQTAGQRAATGRSAPETATAAAPEHLAPRHGSRRAESRVVVIAMTYSQGTVSGGVNNRRNGDVQRVPEPSERRTGLRQRRLRHHRLTGGSV